jgi:hypothetical protein
MTITRAVPWWGKVFVKSVIGLLPFSYEKLRASLIGYNGEMETPDYARNTFDHFLAIFRESGQVPQGGTLLELGPGGSLLSAVYGRALGFGKTILIDVEDYATMDPALYAACLDVLSPGDRERFQSRLQEGDVASALDSIGAEYYTNGLDSVRELPDESIDYSFSNAVLEHVRKYEFDQLWVQLNRIHKRGTLSAHQVDFRDHLGGGLNNLRFPERVWESAWLANQAYYTNRLRHGEVCTKFASAGFSVLDEKTSCWDVVPLSTKRMAREFRDTDATDLKVFSSLITLQKA